MKKAIIAILIILILLVGCTNDYGTKAFVPKDTYTDSEINSYIEEEEIEIIAFIATQYFNKQDVDSSLEILDKAIDHCPHPKYYTLKAIIYHSIYELDKLEDLRIQGMTLFNDIYQDQDALFQLMYGIFLSKVGEHTTSTQIILACIDQIEDHDLIITSYETIAENYLHLKNINEYVRYGTKTIDEGNTNIYFLLHLAHRAHREGHVSSALSTYKAIYELEPDNLLAIKGYATSLYESGNYKDSLKLWDQYINAAPEDVETVTSFIETAKELNDYETVKELEKKLP